MPGDPSLPAALDPVFRANFETRGDLGASVSIWKDGVEIASLHAGFRDRAKTKPWTADTIVPFWSATKGLAATSVLLALHEAEHHPETRFAELWPELNVGDLTVGQLLSHQGGLAGLNVPPAVDDYEAVIRALEVQSTAPNWTPGEAHGYHPRTFGFLADELVRRLTGGQTLGQFWRARIAEPLKLDLWIGLPESEDHRVAELLPAKGAAADESSAFYQAFADPNSLSRKAFGSPRGLHAVSDLNRPENWRLALPAMSGIGTASSLAKFYSILAAGGVWESEQVLPAEIRSWAQHRRVSGKDRVLLMDTSFSAGFMMDPVDESGNKLRTVYGPSLSAFGHPGAGGSHAFADPENGLGFAYVMNQMELSVLPTEKSRSLVEALYSWLGERRSES